MKVGNIVRLKSGGPNMTVHTVDDDMNDPDAEVTCTWFDESEEQFTRVFPAATLKLISEE